MGEINPEDIFIDSTNLPGFDEFSLEGRIERPMGEKTFLFVRAALALIVLVLVFKLGHVMGRDPRRIPRRLERTELLTEQNIHAAAQKYLPADRYTVLSLLPETAATPTTSIHRL